MQILLLQLCAAAVVAAPSNPRTLLGRQEGNSNPNDNDNGNVDGIGIINGSSNINSNSNSDSGPNDAEATTTNAEPGIVTASAGASSASAASSSSSSASSDPSWTVRILVPVVIFAVVLVTIGVLYRFRRQIRQYFESSSGTHAFHPVDGRGPVRHLTAEELALGVTPTRNRAATTATTTTTGGGSTTTGTAATTTVAAGERRPARRSYRRQLRRTESGHSVRTLPEYSKEAGDREIVLVPQRSASIISEEDASASEDEDAPRGYLHVSTDGNVDGDGTADSLNDNGAGTRSGDGAARSDSRRSARSTRSTRSIRSASADTTSSGSQEVILPARLADGAEPHSAPAAAGPGAALSRVRDSLSRRGWGEAPSYLEAMSSPFFSSSSSNAEDGGVPPPRSGPAVTLRERTTSGFRGLLSRAGLAPSSFRPGGHQMSQRPSSQASLLLQPTTSRMSTLTTGTVGATSPWASTHSLLISSPLPHTAVRASFDLPRAGVSDEQMRFLSSKEAVNLAGLPLHEPPSMSSLAAKRRRRASSAATGGGSGVGGSGVDGVDGVGGVGGVSVSGVGGVGGGPGSAGEARGSGSGREELRSGREELRSGREDGGGGELPSWDELDQERRRTEAAARRTLAQPAQPVRIQRDAGAEGDEAGEGGRTRPELGIQLPASAASADSAASAVAAPVGLAGLAGSAGSAGSAGLVPEVEVSPPTTVAVSDVTTRGRR